jgi:hypothetical protein
MANAPIEAKAYTGTVATFAAGYLATLLIEIIPWLKDNLTPDQVQNLPIFLATVITAIASYYAPHTSRPDLIPVSPAGRHASPAPEPVTAPTTVVPKDETATAG